MEISLDRIGKARAVLLAGTTASGKSAAALGLAEEAASRGRAAVIVNADSMQVYDALRILTARPTLAEEARAQHRLYGHVPASERYSVGAWLADVRPVLAEAATLGALPIVVGGTGLYFKSLTEGIVAMPAIPSEVRASLSQRMAEQGALALHAELAARDAGAGQSIRPADRQRILRALEVLEATGSPLSTWQRAAHQAPLVAEEDAACFVIEPPRDVLYRRIDDRFDRMVEQGAVAEVEDLLRLNLDPQMPIMKATGVRELTSVIRNELPLAEGTARAKMESRRYAKRQMTWFRNQMRGWQRIDG